MASRSLYPPIVDTYPAAFVKSASCKIKFSYSSLNSSQSASKMELTIINKKTNKSVVINNSSSTTSTTANNILKKIIQKDDDGSFYVEILNKDVESFLTNTYYQVQMRLVSDDEKDKSEWSSACLVKPIATPYFSLTNFTDIDDSADTKNIKSFFDLSLIEGNLSFLDDNGNIDENESEMLKSYSIIISHEEEDENTGEYNIIEDLNSGELYTDASSMNTFSYASNLNYDTTYLYTLTVAYTTTNSYSNSLKNYFKIYNYNTTNQAAALTSANLQTQRGCIDVAMNVNTKFRNISLSRGCSKDNYKYWDELQIIPLYDQGYKEHYYDYTVESGYNYKYVLREIDSYGNYTPRSQAVSCASEVDLEHAYLFRNGIQLCIKYNPEISNFKHSINETITETIGSKFPFFRRKGLTGYRTFSLTGTIESGMDEFFGSNLGNNNSVMLHNEEETKVSAGSYEAGNNVAVETVSHTFYDSTFNKKSINKQRFFREKVIEFLQADNVKMYRSAAEGNILVKITDVNLTPKTELGRRVWDFSATLTEVDECSVSNCFKYGVLVKNDYVSDFIDYNRHCNQIYGEYKLGDDLFSAAEELCERYIEANSKINNEENNNITLNGITIEKTNDVYNYYYRDIRYLTSLHLEIDPSSLRPCLIDTSDIPYVVSGNGNDSDIEWSNLDDVNSHCVLGYLLSLNDDIRIIIPPHGIIDIEKDLGLKITSIKVLGSEQQEYEGTTFKATMSYGYLYVDNSVKEKYPETIKIKKTAGQLKGIFSSSDTNLYNTIYGQQYYDFEYSKSFLINLSLARIEAEPGTWLSLRDTKDETLEYSDFIINSTGILELVNEDISLNGLKVKGKKFIKKNSKNNFSYPLGCYLTEVLSKESLYETPFSYFFDEETKTYSVNSGVIESSLFVSNEDDSLSIKTSYKIYEKCAAIGDKNEIIEVPMSVSLNIEYDYIKEIIDYQKISTGIAT